MSAPEEKNGTFEIPADIALADEPYGMAVRPGDRKFLDLVNGVLTDLKNSGEAEKIFAKWLRGVPEAPAAAAPGYEEYKAKADQAHRRKKQEAYEESKNRYDYEYDDSFGWGYGGWGGGWHGYYRW
jgi:hypothetical protein